MDSAVHILSAVRILSSDYTAEETRYVVHDNGGRPFCVRLVNSGPNTTVYVHRMVLHRETIANNLPPGDHYIADPVATFHRVRRVFVGKSPDNEMTRYSGGIGARFDGNSILINTEEDQYVFVGHHIFSFTCKEEIVHYESAVGNSNVPYPWAITASGAYIMMLELPHEKSERKEVKTIRFTEEPKDGDDIYSMFYRGRGFEIVPGMTQYVKELHERLW